jgi:enoyl-CoA hydratase
VNYETLEIEHVEDGRLAVVTINRPEAYNALNTQLAKDITSAFALLEKSAQLRCAILTGSGPKAFCAGADLKERLDMSGEEWRAQHETFEGAFTSLRTFKAPLIAAVNGVAAGGGLELALNTDFILASTNARFGQPEVKVGLIPGGGALQLLPAYVGLGFARQLLMTGELIDAQRALASGLVNSVHEPLELRSAAVELAAQVAANSPMATRAVKEVVADSHGRPVEEAIDRGLEAYGRLVDGSDRYEGVRAFNERRTPQFSD